MPSRRYLVTRPNTAQVAAPVAFSFKDPVTSNLDTYWTTAAANPANPTSGIGQALYLSQQNIAGNDLFVLANCANDFGTGPDPAGNTITSVFDPVNGGYTLVGSLLNNLNDCNTDIGLYIKRNAQPLLSTSWSGQGAVSSGGILTLSGSISGTMRIGQRILSTHTPAVSNTGGETVILSLQSGTLGQSGSTYQLSGGIGTTTFAAEAMTTRDFITAQATVRTNPAQRDYPGMACVELFGTDGINAFFGGQNYTTPGAGSGNMSTGNIVGSSTPGLIICLHMNGGADNAPLTPTLDSGWSGQSYGIYNLGSGIQLLAYKHVSNLGTQAGTASLGSSNNCISVGAMFPDHP